MTRLARGAFFFSTEGVLEILTDNVNHPAHYEAGPFECVELTRLYPFMGGNAIKYVYRHRLKGRDAEDLRKALWYLDHAEPDELRPSYARRDAHALGAATPLPVPSMEADLARGHDSGLTRARRAVARRINLIELDYSDDELRLLDGWSAPPAAMWRLKARGMEL